MMAQDDQTAEIERLIASMSLEEKLGQLTIIREDEANKSCARR